MAIRYYVSTEEASFFNNNRMGYANSIPTEGNYKVGDFIISSIQENGVFGWVCTVAGNPGEWEVIGSGAAGGNKVVGYVNAVSFSNTRNSIEIGIDEYEKGKDLLEVHYNGLLLAEGVHYNVSADGKSITAIDDIWNENADDTQQMIFRVLKSEGANLKELKNTIDINYACYEVETGISVNPDKDIIEVHLNGVMLIQGVDYEVVGGKITKLDRSEAWNPYNVNGQKMFIRVLRNNASVIEPTDGSITIDKLSDDIKEDLAAIDGLIASVGMQNTTISNINNRVGVIEEKIEDVDNAISAISGKQDKSDNGLITTEKTIVGAINEVENETNNIKQSLVDVLNTKGIPCDANQSWFNLFGLLIENLNSGGGNGSGGNDGGDINLLSGQWSELKSIGTARNNIGVCVCQGKIYCLGGLKGDDTASNLFTCYDPSTDNWETLTSFPLNIYGAACTANEETGTIHVHFIMDTPNSASCIFKPYFYNISNNTWNKTVDSPNGGSGTAIPSKAFMINDRATLLDRDSGKLGIRVYTAGTGFDYIYDTNSNYPNTYIGSANCCYNGIIYSIGGYTGNGTSGVSAKNKIVSVDLNNIVSSELSPLPVYIIGASAEVYDGMIYVFGGRETGVEYNGDFRVNNNIYVYDINNDTWSTMENKGIDTTYAGSCIIDNKIYVFGGDTGNYMNYLPEADTVSNKSYVFIIGEDNDEPEQPQPVYDTYLLKDGTLVTNGEAYNTFGNMNAAGGVYSEGSYLKLSFSYNTQVISFNKYIGDFSKYTTVQVTMYSDSTSSTPYLYVNQFKNAGVSGTFTNSNRPEEYNYAIKQLNNNSTKHTYTFDISGWTGVGYLGFTATNDNRTGTIYITDIEIL